MVSLAQTFNVHRKIRAKMVESVWTDITASVKPGFGSNNCEDLVNIAAGKRALASSVFEKRYPNRAVDGIRVQTKPTQNCMYTNDEPTPVLRGISRPHVQHQASRYLFIHRQPAPQLFRQRVRRAPGIG